MRPEVGTQAQYRKKKPPVIQPHARQLVDHSAEMGLPPATYVQVAVKVIDDRGNELLVVKALA